MMMSICPYCHTGRLERRAMIYVQWHGDQLLVVDRLPAVVCNVCGERAYDERAVEHLQRLLWSSVGGVSAPRSQHLA